MINKIKSLILNAIPDAKIEIQDKSDSHRGHVGLKNQDYSSSHVNIVVVSDSFEGKRTFQRHKILNDAVGHLVLENQIHAISFKTFTEGELSKLR
jgi:BolA protein